MSEQDIPASAKEFARQGHLIEAVKVTRERTGLSLRDAKNAVDDYLRDPDGASRASRPHIDRTSFAIPSQAVASLEAGRFLDAVKHTRNARKLGLKAAKGAVEDFLRHRPDINARFRAASAAEFGRVARKLVTIMMLFGILLIAYVYLQTP
jgi:ribosomal protein L7/L12